ncbi:hypothetical protein BCR37DRAFT_166159 [Protomyces lactucae-debilis]|uniref:Protein BZZ1 n=1 Tax=Protomyces lactucae-debilis TaxID=2754530 RepID=A0A1Y2EXS0_PROLT|nr:uncharacterized protein BCR37DRAFT_166159 [Protomyces lactucae-debilis]ORY76393.1 hypothetical protein BCR37DRAFT_166159 [Protomyces lactucae-debilis]
MATIGEACKDGYKQTDNWAHHGIKWLEEIQEYYRERATLEKEYGSKLQQLSKKYQEKRVKKSGSLSVGDAPAMTPGSLENASLTTWSRILEDARQLGDERVTLSSEFTMQVAEPIKAMHFKWEDFQKRVESFHGKLVEERDKTSSNVKQVQKKYYDGCAVVEKERAKHGSAKATKQLTGSMADMSNLKNTYIIAINAANAHKAKYYHEDTPDLLNMLQDMNEVRVQRLNALWQRASQVEQSCLTRQGGHLQRSVDAIGQNDPKLDTNMFVQHNSAPFQEPAAFGFEACPIWHDTPDLVTDEPAKIFLQNNLARSRGELTELKTTVSNKKREIDGLTRLKQQHLTDPAKQGVETVLHNLLQSKMDVASLDTRRNILETEVGTIVQVVGDIDRGMQPHGFKSASFTIPTHCDYCGSTIWGMSRKGYHCKACAYNCHKACQMKVPANCTGVKGEKKGGDGLQRTNTADSVYGTGKGTPAETSDEESSDGASLRSTTRPAVAAARPNRAPVPAAGFANGNAHSHSTRVLYAYDAAGSGEVSIKAGDTVTVLQGDDGAGWIQIKSGGGSIGLVPAAYVEDATPKLAAVSAAQTGPNLARVPSSGSVASSLTKRQGPAVAPKRTAAKKSMPAGRRVRALYAYTAASGEEISLVPGEIVIVTAEDGGDGWATGVSADGQSGLFPAAYAESA